MNVDHLMNAGAQACSPENNLAEVVAIMWHDDVGAVPILDDARKVIGIVTDRDICMALSDQPRLAGEVKVKELASKETFICHPDDNIHAAMETMKRHRVRRLPVVDDEGKLLGMLSMSTVILQAEPVGVKRSPGVTCEDVVKALKGICEPSLKSS